MKPRSKVLIIAGSDSSGGAGIQADIKTVTSLGSYAMTAITAVTAQNTTGVSSIVSINSKEIFKQIVFTCKDIKPDAIKIGMLHSPKIIKAVISALKKIKVSKIARGFTEQSKASSVVSNNKAVLSGEDEEGIRIKSPIIGTAYLSPEPGGKKFVEIGDKIKKGQTIMIVEAMKTMNHVPSTNEGVVKTILVNDGQPVEFGQSLIVLK